jgi:hypothetical protein
MKEMSGNSPAVTNFTHLINTAILYTLELTMSTKSVKLLAVLTDTNLSKCNAQTYMKNNTSQWGLDHT